MQHATPKCAFLRCVRLFMSKMCLFLYFLKQGVKSEQSLGMVWITPIWDYDLEPKFFWTKFFFWDLICFWAQNLFGSKIFLDPIFFLSKFFLSDQIFFKKNFGNFFGHKSFFNTKFFLATNIFFRHNLFSNLTFFPDPK